jgi:hypothetical protein
MTKLFAATGLALCLAASAAVAQTADSMGNSAMSSSMSQGAMTSPAKPKVSDTMQHDSMGSNAMTHGTMGAAAAGSSMGNSMGSSGGGAMGGSMGNSMSQTATGTNQ